MCRNIKQLFNFDPPASKDEVEGAARQFVRKVSGMTSPTGANQAACDQAVQDVSRAIERMLDQLSTSARPKNREIEAARARERSARRFPQPVGRD